MIPPEANPDYGRPASSDTCAGRGSVCKALATALECDIVHSRDLVGSFYNVVLSHIQFQQKRVFHLVRIQ